MSRNINSLDQEVVARVERLIKKGILQKRIAQRVRLDIRWISDIAVAMKRREAAAEAERQEKVLIERVLKEPDKVVEEQEILEDAKESTDTFVDKMRQLLRKTIPARKRVRVIKALLDSPNAQLQKAGLDQLNAIEGIGKKGQDKPYEPGPMFIIDTVPDFRMKKVKRAKDPRDKYEEIGGQEADYQTSQADPDTDAGEEVEGEDPVGGTGTALQRPPGDHLGRPGPDDDCTDACPGGAHTHIYRD